MRKFYDICHGKEITGSDKKAWTRLGSAMENDKGISAIFDYAPPCGEWLALFPRDSKNKNDDDDM